MEFLPIDRGAAPFDLTVEATGTPGGLEVTFEYNADLFDPATVERMTLRCCSRPARPARHPDLGAAARYAQRHHLVVVNRTEEEYPRGQRVHELFEAQVERTPEAVALICGDVRLSYRELDRRAERLAAALSSRGVGPEARVGVYLERSADLLVALLAVLKAGGAYLPLDSPPAERVRAVLEDAGAAW
jgi:non-ribosomal peptide synthetase component F